MMLEKNFLSALNSFFPLMLNKSRTMREQGSVKVDYGKFNKEGDASRGDEMFVVKDL